MSTASRSDTRRFTVNDLPRFSPWPSRLLGFEPWQQRRKTPQEVTREYELEKWGPLLARVKDAGRSITLDQVEAWVSGDQSHVLCSIGDELELLTPREVRDRYLAIVDDVLRRYVPASALVELGCGYGGVLLALAQRHPFREMSMLAGEFAPSGVELVRHLAALQGSAVTAAACDFSLPRITTLDVPPDALILTSYAVHYVPTLSPDFVTTVAAWRPRAVVHLEPCYEHCDGNTLLGLMRRRYVEVNDYNTNLVTVLRESERRGAIKIVEERPAVFGENPLLAASIVVWTVGSR